MNDIPEELYKEKPWLQFYGRDEDGKYSCRLFNAFLGEKYYNVYGQRMESSDDVLIFLFDIGWAHYRFSEIYGDHYRPRNKLAVSNALPWNKLDALMKTREQLTRMGFGQMYNTPKLQYLSYGAKRIFVDLVETYFPEDAGKYYYILDLNENGEKEDDNE